MSLANRERPGPETKTGRVWEIADELTRRTGMRARRSAVIEAYVREGGNAATANTQFQKWLSAFEGKQDAAGSGLETTLVVRQGGRIVLPAGMRSVLGVSEGDALSARLVDGELRLVPRAAARNQARALVRRFVKPGVNLVDALLAERRKEAQKER